MPPHAVFRIATGCLVLFSDLSPRPQSLQEAVAKTLRAGGMESAT